MLKIAFGLLYSLLTYCYSIPFAFIKYAQALFSSSETSIDDDAIDSFSSMPRPNSFSVFESVSNMRGKSRKNLEALFDDSITAPVSVQTESTDVLQHLVCGKPALLATRASVAACEVNLAHALETVDMVYENQHYMMLGWYGWWMTSMRCCMNMAFIQGAKPPRPMPALD